MSVLGPRERDIVGFLELLWESLKGLPSVLAMVAAVAAFALSPDWVVELRWVLPVGIVGLALLVALADSAWMSFVRRDKGLPAIVSACQPPAGYDPSPVLCLLEPSELFSQGDLVSLYYRDENELEVLLGFGAVLNIQIDKKIQVIMTDPLGNADGVINRLAANEEDTRRRILIKPNVPQVRTPESGDAQE